MNSTRIAVLGAAGRMGRAVIQAAAAAGLPLGAAFERTGAAELGRDAGELAGPVVRMQESGATAVLVESDGRLLGAVAVRELDGEAGVIRDLCRLRSCQQQLRARGG